MLLSEDELEKYRVREWDQNGRLTRAGFTWVEIRPKVQTGLNVVQAIFGLTMFGGGIGVIISLMDGSTKGAAISGAISVISILIMAFSARAGASKAYYLRQVVFCDDGQILVAEPEYRDFNERKPPLGPIQKKVHEIARIEGKRETSITGKPATTSLDLGGTNMPSHAVQLVFSDGQSGLITYNQIDEDVVRLIVVQLTQALNEIRESIAKKRSPQAASTQGRTFD